MQTVKLIGEIRDNFTFFRKAFEENLYTTLIYVKRKSDIEDVLKVVVPEYVKQDLGALLSEGNPCTVELKGEFRSKNIHVGDVSRVFLYIYATDFEVVSADTPHENRIEFDGFIAKTPIFRKTPRGREITDLCIAINRIHGRASDYIPTLAWNEQAVYASKLEISSHIRGVGRVQSRDYIKWFDNGEFEERTCYEMSLTSFSYYDDEAEKESASVEYTVKN